MHDLSPDAALLVIDLQRAIDHECFAGRNNPQAEKRVLHLLHAWRNRKRPIYHIRHDSQEPESPYRPGQPLHAFKPETAPLEGETVVPKRTNNAFIGTDLEARLKAAGHRILVVTGVLSHNSVEATVRMAGNLGFETYLVADATAAIPKRGRDGTLYDADTVHEIALANMDGEYARVVDSREVLAAIASF